MARTKTKPTPRRRRCYNDDFTPMSYQGWAPAQIREELKGWITDPGALDLFVRICELLKPQRIERISLDGDARAVLAFAAFTGPVAGEHGEWEEIYKRTDDYIQVSRMDEKRITPMVIELRNLLIGWRNHRKLQAARKAKGGAS